MSKKKKDQYLEHIEEQREHIIHLYDMFADKFPVMLYDIQNNRIYAYPYESFKADLSTRSQNMLKDQYEHAVTHGHIVVFVRDNENRKLLSYSLPH